MLLLCQFLFLLFPLDLSFFRTADTSTIDTAIFLYTSWAIDAIISPASHPLVTADQIEKYSKNSL